MKSRFICFFIAFFLIRSAALGFQQNKSSSPQSSLFPDELRCEYLVDPLGIDRIHPRLSWILLDTHGTRGQKQTSYQVIVAGSEKELDADVGELWDTGKMLSGQTNQIEYNGKTLTSRMRCFWKVRIWDAADRVSAWSKPAFWTMGLLRDEDWKAEWIGSKSVVLTGDKEKDSVSRFMTPSPLLRKTFTNRAIISRATMYVTSLGLYEIRLNRVKVGDHALAPEWTDYQKRVQYQTYDVTGLITEGENVISAMLADGWYIGPMGTPGDIFTGRGKNYGSLDRKLLMQLEVETADGRVERVVSDKSWRVYPDGPMQSADIYLGEIFDSRKIPHGWEMPGFDDSLWEQAVLYPAPSVSRVAQMYEPVRVVRELNPIAVTEPAKGTYVFDLGQNMVGWCALKVEEPSGKEVTLRHGEMLDDSGKLYTGNLRRARATDRFVADGRSIQVYEPRFTYHGFRYVEVTGLSKRPDLSALIGKEVSSAVRAAGRFGCSNTDLNKLWSNILWTQRNNLIGIPTDCPQRDERLGWMTDAQVFSQTAMFNCDMEAFFTKWLQDIRDAQSEEGQYPDVAPEPPALKFYGAPAWADAGVIVPWKVYENYGDIRILQEHYSSAKRFVDYVHSKNPSLIRTEAVGNQYGDWLNGNAIISDGYPKNHGQVPHAIFNTIYFAVSARLLSQMAAVLRYDDDAKFYAKLSDDIRDSLVKRYVDSDGVVTGNTQAGYALMLGFDLLPEQLRAKAFENLLKCVAEYDFRMSTGFLSTIKMMDELVRGGRADVAYELLESRRFPSWLYEVDQGATTIWERWDGYVKGRGFQDTIMNSFDHYAIGSVGEWMYKHIAGIQWTDEHPGYREFTVHPQIGGSLTWANGAYSSINGEIVSQWKLEGGVLHLHVEIPPNTVARVYIPAKGRSSVKESGKKLEDAPGVKFLKMEGSAAVCEAGSGVYDFTSEYGKEK